MRCALAPQTHATPAPRWPYTASCVPPILYKRAPLPYTHFFTFSFPAFVALAVLALAILVPMRVFACARPAPITLHSAQFPPALQLTKPLPSARFVHERATQESTSLGCIVVERRSPPLVWVEANHCGRCSGTGLPCSPERREEATHTRLLCRQHPLRDSRNPHQTKELPLLWFRCRELSGRAALRKQAITVQPRTCRKVVLPSRHWFLELVHRLRKTEKLWVSRPERLGRRGKLYKGDKDLYFFGW